MDKTDCGLSLRETVITDLVFDDDVVIFAEMMEVLVHALDTLSTESECVHPSELSLGYFRL